MRYDDIPVANYYLTDSELLRTKANKLEITEKEDRNDELPNDSTIRVEPQEQYPIPTIPTKISKKKKTKNYR